MVRRMARIPLALIVLAVLWFDVYLLLGARDGARVVHDVEAALRRPLSCYELYADQRIQTSFSAQNPTRGTAIYAFVNALLPLWLLASVGSALALRRAWKPQRWRQAATIMLGTGTGLIILCVPLMQKLSCALE